MGLLIYEFIFESHYFFSQFSAFFRRSVREPFFEFSYFFQDIHSNIINKNSEDILKLLITCENMTFGYDGEPILENINFTINEGDRIGFIGGNGEGKTTLIKLILSSLSPDSGRIILKNGMQIGYLEQNSDFPSEKSVYDEMKSVFKEDIKAVENLNELSVKISASESGSDEYRILSAKYEHLNRFIDSRDSYNYDVKIKTVLNGMGFEKRYNQKISTMSGGEKTKLKLCRLLLENPEILILDEPTNHLDIKTLFWLEDYLNSFKGALFIVSHDRYFLDKLANKIYELEYKKLSEFKGNYSKYKILKAEKTALIQKEYEKQQAERAHMQEFVDRFRYKATKAKSAQSRIKQLDKMEIIEKPKLPPSPPAFRFSYEERPYEKVLEIKSLTLSAGEKTLIKDGNLLVKRGEKCAVVGDNGTGKSTLIRRIVNGGDTAILTARFVKIAYYDQENANLNPENTVLAELWERHVSWSQTEIRNILARLRLDEGDVDKKVKFLSGGERAKLALAVFEAEKGNFLILDEPTNHLDLAARESLEEAIKNFDGTVLFVSHDRYFIQSIADKIAEISDGHITEFKGNYEEYNSYKRSLADKVAPEKKTEEKIKDTSYKSKSERAAEAEKETAYKRDRKTNRFTRKRRGKYKRRNRDERGGFRL